MDQDIIRPQEGFQEKFLSSPADIVIGGGSAGAGKTYVLLYEFIRHKDVKGFGGVIFRRTTPQVTNEGGLWDTSYELYPLVGGKPNLSSLTWKFSTGPKIKFSHLEYEDDKLNWQGTQIAYLGFDELTHFTRGQFFYLLGRNRSMSGIKPYVRATCNPDPDSWVAELIAWWIDPESGFPIPERDGAIRYFISDSNHLVWGDSRQEVIDKCPHIFNDPKLKNRNPEDLVKSITFIAGDVYGNEKLLQKNPGYLANLLSLDEAEQLQLLKGNWKIRQDGSAMFDYIAINDIFTNFVQESTFRGITCDVARFGRDLAVIATWRGNWAYKIEVFTKSSTVDLFNAIEADRKEAKIPRSKVAVDEGGVGGGVVDQSGGEYYGFISNAAALPNPVTKIKENYSDLKTQCYYRCADEVNNGNFAVSLDNIYVNGVKAEEIRIGKEIFSIKKLIAADLRSAKKKNKDMDGRKRMNDKDEQKNILNGRSPDFGDCLTMRAVLDLLQKPEPGIRILE